VKNILLQFKFSTYLFLFSALMIVMGHRIKLSHLNFQNWNKYAQYFMSINHTRRFSVVIFFAATGVLVTMTILRALDRYENF
jgi:hypothetical protein